MNNYLNRLKELLAILASICLETKYFELKNKLIVYEIKFKKFLNQHEPQPTPPHTQTHTSITTLTNKKTTSLIDHEIIRTQIPKTQNKENKENKENENTTGELILAIYFLIKAKDFIFFLF